MLLYAKQLRWKGRWEALCADAGGEAWTPCSLNKHKDHCGPTGKGKEEALIFSRRFSHVDSKLMLQLKYLEPNSALSHAGFSWFIPKSKQCNQDQNLAPTPTIFIRVHEWQMMSLFIFFNFKLPTWFWTRSELCLQGCQSGRVDTWAERQSWRHKSLHGGAGCALGGGSSRLCCVSGTPKLAWARRNGSIWHWDEVSFKECIWCLQHLKSQVMQRAVGAAVL